MISLIRLYRYFLIFNTKNKPKRETPKTRPRKWISKAGVKQWKQKSLWSVTNVGYLKVGQHDLNGDNTTITEYWLSRRCFTLLFLILPMGKMWYKLQMMSLSPWGWNHISYSSVKITSNIYYPPAMCKREWILSDVKCKLTFKDN